MEKFLKEHKLFQDISPATLERLIGESKEEVYAPGETIIEFGQPGRFLGIVIEGRAEAVVDDPDKGRRRLGWLNSGDFFGEMSLMTGEPTGAHVIADEKSRVLLIPQKTFTAYLLTNPAVVKLIAKTITVRLQSREQNEEERGRVDSAWKKHPDPYGLSLQTPQPMKMLVINCGSSSLKYNFFDTQNPGKNARGLIERIGLEGTKHHCHSKNQNFETDLERGDHGAAFKSMMDTLLDSERGVIRDLKEIDAVGHRVVHGGEKYSKPTIVTQDILKELEDLAHLAPLHNPVNVLGIKESVKLLPETPQVAVFDTAFHHKIPAYAHLYGLPYEYYKEHAIRRYGFHGLSHHYVGLKAAEFLKTPFTSLKLVTCHLGNGASVCAVDHGYSVDTSMGLTPTEGLIMGTRSGDLDPSVVLYLQRNLGLTAEEVDDLINKKSGLCGLSGVSNDLREIQEAAENGDRRSLLAIQVFCYRIKKYIGSYTAAMGGVDAVIFTGGIGEGSVGVRARTCQGMDYMGIKLDDLKNQSVCLENSDAADISQDNSPVRILVIPTQEERMIARETIRTLGYKDIADTVLNWSEKPIPIEVSAHHLHLSKIDTKALFGEDCDLTVRAELSQPGQFACNETVNLIGPKGRVDRVRVLGPYRPESQVEISITEEFKLGISAPVRPSGALDGTPGIVLEGPQGQVTMEKGVIASLRHIHMTPEDALFFGLHDRDMVRIRIEGERSLIFGDVLVRVHPDFRLSMHLDTDEANAAEIKTGMIGYLEAIQDRK
jgi:acetate kinase